MYILSFDVGRKNLAFVLIQLNNDHKPQIITFDVCNIESGKTSPLDKCKKISSLFKLIVDQITLASLSSSNQFEGKLSNREFEGLEGGVPSRQGLEVGLPSRQGLEVIIERQYPNNQVAMELQYALIATSLKYTDKVILFDPKLKFTALGIPYSTINKKHKQTSIKLAEIALRNISNLEANQLPIDKPINSESYTRFNDLVKKDDVADAINQAFVYANLIDLYGTEL
jgi:hypothetical protein